MRIYTYRHYEYELTPLFFLDMGTHKIAPEHKVEILTILDFLYGETDQETTDWALEYQLWTRMLLCDNALLINPQYLDMECDSDLLPIELHDVLVEALSEAVFNDYATALRSKEAIETFDGEGEYIEFPSLKQSNAAEPVKVFPDAKVRLDMEHLMSRTKDEKLLAILQSIVDRGETDKVFTVWKYLPHTCPKGPVLLKELPNVGFAVEDLIVTE